MIALLHGPLVSRDVDHAVLDVHGVGFEVFIPAASLETLPHDGAPVTLHVHTHVREDAITLFGFVHPGDRQLFLRLLGVSGIGPRLALAALGAWGGTALRDAIARGDEKALSRIPGIGKRTAQRLVLELADKVAAIDTGEALTGPAAATSGATSDVLEDLALALTGLGFPPRSVEDTCARLADRAQDGSDLQGLLREALRILRP